MDLRELQKSYLDNLRKVTEDKLEIGSLVRTVISIEEGLVFKDGRKQKPKKLVIIGVDKVKKVCYGSVLVLFMPHLSSIVFTTLSVPLVGDRNPCGRVLTLYPSPKSLP